MHCESVALLQVTPLVQCATGVHERQLLAGFVLSSQLPSGHSVHCESVGVVHVRAERQRSTGVQDWQMSAVFAEPI